MEFLYRAATATSAISNQDIISRERERKKREERGRDFRIHNDAFVFHPLDHEGGIRATRHATCRRVSASCVTRTWRHAFITSRKIARRRTIRATTTREIFDRSRIRSRVKSSIKLAPDGTVWNRNCHGQRSVRAERLSASFSALVCQRFSPCSTPLRFSLVLPSLTTFSLVLPAIPIHILDFLPSSALPPSFAPNCLPTSSSPLATIRSLAPFYSGCLSIVPAL